MPAMTLDTVEEAFIAWRKNRSSRTEPIPQSLWERIFHRCPPWKAKGRGG